MEVINTGVGGWHPFQYAQYFEYYGQHFEPDVVIIGFFVGNDAYSRVKEVRELPTVLFGRRVRRWTAERSPRRVSLGIFFYERSHLVRLVLNRSRLAPQPKFLRPGVHELRGVIDNESILSRAGFSTITVT